MSNTITRTQRRAALRKMREYSKMYPESENQTQKFVEALDKLGMSPDSFEPGSGVPIRTNYRNGR